jgi:hypothetical protein
MGAIYPLSVQRRFERQWAERITSLRQTRGLDATERALQRAAVDSSLIPVSVRRVTEPINLDQTKPHD